MRPVIRTYTPDLRRTGADGVNYTNRNKIASGSAQVMLQNDFALMCAPIPQLPDNDSGYGNTENPLLLSGQRVG